MLRNCLLFCLCVSGAASPLLRFNPPGASVAPGGTVLVDVVLSGLPAGGPPSVGSFDLDVVYNPSVLAPLTLQFGPFLGQEGLGEVINFAFESSGLLDFGAVSLLTAPELDALQPEEFLLARLEFLGLAPGTSMLAFEQILIDDSDGIKLPVEGTGGSVTVTPEPATFALSGVALISLRLMLARRRNQRPKM